MTRNRAGSPRSRGRELLAGHCIRCGAVGTHYLTCPSLRLPSGYRLSEDPGPECRCGLPAGSCRACTALNRWWLSVVIWLQIVSYSASRSAGVQLDRERNAMLDTWTW